MKTRITNKDAKNIAGANNVFVAGYCELYYLLRYHKPQFYNTGIYGWNWDGYLINGIMIITGYRNLKGIDIPYTLAEKYNNIAKDSITKEKTEMLIERMIERTRKEM